IERALIESHLAFDRRQRVVRVDVPAIGEPRGAPDRDIGIGADPDRRHRLLHRLYRTGRLVQLEMRALHCDGVLGPQPLYRFKAFLEALAKSSPWHAERLELAIAVADAAADDGVAVHHGMEGSEVLGACVRIKL